MSDGNVLRRLFGSLRQKHEAPTNVADANTLQPAVDDAKFYFGDGTKSWDIRFYGNDSASYIEWDASANELRTVGSAVLLSMSKIQAKTANYTVVASDSGTIITNRGASGAITITLPTVAAGFTGVDVTIYVVAGQDVTISAQTAGQLVVFNDATANSVVFSTASEKIGGGFRCICDGTSWLVIPLNWADVGGAAQTATITT